MPIVIAGDSVACACTGGSFTKPELKLNACDLRFSQIAIFLYSHKKGYFAFDGECIYPININNAQTNEEIMNAIIRGNFSDTTVTYHFLKSLSNEGFTFEIIQGGKAVAKFKVKRGIKRRDANGVVDSSREHYFAGETFVSTYSFSEL
ncbi:hypothetical protein [Runella sp.]|uniref:hypothetical protein n=1 Tax=Runella sp. TaxID=1960881 RepID=UPI00260B0CB7|nr:hypothetical protein [Runella sp.]